MSNTGSNKKSSLGRGLAALLENSNTDITNKYAGEAPVAATVGNVAKLKISQLVLLVYFLPMTKTDNLHDLVSLLTEYRKLSLQ